MDRRLLDAPSISGLRRDPNGRDPDDKVRQSGWNPDFGQKCGKPRKLERFPFPAGAFSGKVESGFPSENATMQKS